jgi:hypothetical protein
MVGGAPAVDLDCSAQVFNCELKIPNLVPDQTNTMQAVGMLGLNGEDVAKELLRSTKSSGSVFLNSGDEHRLSFSL